MPNILNRYFATYNMAKNTYYFIYKSRFIFIKQPNLIITPRRYVGMEFDRGMVGALIVILSLIASVGLGVVTNIETRTVDKDVAEYVADITGAFSSEKQQSYTEYNPSSNYNGYTNNTVSDDYAVDFEQSNYTNNYYMTYAGTTVTETFIPSDFGTELDVTPTQEGYNTYSKYTEVRTTVNLPEHKYFMLYYNGPRQYTSDANINYGAKIPLDSLINELISRGNATPDLTQINITIPVVVGPQTQKTYNEPEYNLNTTIDVPLCADNYFMITGNGYAPNQNTLIDQGANSTFYYRFTYFLATNTGALYLNDSSTPINSGAPSLYTLRWPTVPVCYVEQKAYSYYDETIYGIFETTTYPLPLTENNRIIVDCEYSKHTGYIDTRYGIGIRGTEENPESVIWTNGYQNGNTSIAFSVWDENAVDKFTDNGTPYSMTGTISYYNTTRTDTIELSRIDGYTYISINNNDPVNIGTWSQFQLVLDSVSGKVFAYPIQTWDNFNNYSISPTPIQIGLIAKANLNSITWSANNSLRMEVVNTEVFFNNYGVVMVNPEITPANLWPVYEKYMIDFTKVATIGSAITIGSDTYRITGNKMNIEGVTVDVTDMKITYTKANSLWDVTIESGKNKVTITEDSTYLKFIGTWYFTAGFYNILTKQVQERTWDPTTYNWVESHMFFWMAGILLLLGVVAYKLGYLDWLSILILIATEFILILIGGTT